MKKLIYLLLFFTLGTFSQKKVGQAVIDSLLIELPKTKNENAKVDLLIKIAGLNFGVNPNLPKMLEYAEKAAELSQKTNYKKGLATAYRLQGVFYFATRKLKDAEVFFNKSLLIAQESKDQSNIMANLSNLGVINHQLFKYPDALSYLQKAIRIAEKENRNDIIATTSTNMGVIYAEMKNSDKAINYFEKAIEYHSKINNQIGIAASLGNLGNTYFDKKDFVKALEIYERALAKNLEIKSESGIARENGHIASVYQETNQAEKAFEFYNKALKINEKLKYDKGIALNYQGIANYYLQQKEYENALKFAQKANKIAQDLKDLEIQKETFKDLKTIYEQLNKNDSAYANYKKYIAIKDDLENENTKKQISRLEIQYEFDTKEEKYKVQEILSFEKLNQQKLQLALNASEIRQSNSQRDLINLNFLKTESDLKFEQAEKKFQYKQLTNIRKEIELQSNKLKINNLLLETREKQKWIYILGIGILGILGLSLFYQNQNRKKINKKLETLNQNLDQANKTKLQFFNILNHDLKSPVTNMIHFLHLQKENPEILDQESKQRLQNKTIAGAENLLTSMEDILLWSKGQMQNFKPKLEKIEIQSIFNETKNHFASEENVKIIFENPNQLQIYTDENYLKTIIRNLTGNAIKAISKVKPDYSGQIIWKAFQENNQNFLSITDNGAGATEDQFKALYDDSQVVGIKTGLGLHLIRDLANAIDCEISVKSSLESGTVFLLKFS